MEDFDMSPESIFKDESKFYNDAKTYWSQIPPTVNGMLGGFGCVSNADIRGSETFLKKIFNLKDRPGNGRALDCGAGIGRITKNLLVKNFDQVDLVEQNPKFIEAAEQYLSFENKIGVFYSSGLQEFVPKTSYYDIIWCQWVLGHLTDDHLVNFFNVCKIGLKNNGIIVVKENISPGEVVVDTEDSSVTRPLKVFLDIFERANLEVVRHTKQTNFPKHLYCVKLFALRPRQKPNKIVACNDVRVMETQENGNVDSSNSTDEKSTHTDELVEQLNTCNITTSV